MRKSSSFHSLNADGKLNVFEKRLWTLFNFLGNNYFPNEYKGFSLKNSLLIFLKVIEIRFLRQHLLLGFCLTCFG